MSKIFKLIILLHFTFVLCQFYSEPRFIYRPRKSGTRPRSFKSDWPRKAFETRDRKALDISDIYTDKFLKQVESSLQQKSPGAQQWQAAVETRPRKKDTFPETALKSRQDKNVDISSSEELSSNISEEPTKKQKNPQMEIQQLKEEIRKEKQNREDRNKKKKPEIQETSEQSKSKELKSEQIRNYHYPKSSETAVGEKTSLLREGHHHHSKLGSRQHDHDNHCVKKCYTPECEVECLGRQGSAACSANKCKASTRGSDSAAVCKGVQCQGVCHKDDCIAACEGDSCSVTCEGNICHAVAEGRRTKSACEGNNCVAYGKGPATRPRCKGSVCQTWCVGDNCVAKCHGYHCEAMCSGHNCKAMCVGKNCTQFHNPGKPAPERPWVLDTQKEDSKSQEISISDESAGQSNLPTKPNKDDNDADDYYGNKKHVKNTINGKSEDVVQTNNNGYIDNRDKSGNEPFLTEPAPYYHPASYDNKHDWHDDEADVIIDYSIVVQLTNRLGEYLKSKVFELKDLSLLRYLPRLI